MLVTYRRIMQIPGAWAFVPAGLLIRFPMAMSGIGIVMAYQGLQGGFDRAGVLAGCYFVTSALVTPQIMRLVDRFGQRSVMLPVLGTHLVLLLGLISALLARAPFAVLLGLAVICGACYGSMGALVRARWNHVIAVAPAHQLGAYLADSTPDQSVTQRREQALERAFALESVLDELVFIVGPVGVVLLATAVHPVAGLGLAALCVAAGAVWFFRPGQPIPAPIPVDRSAVGRRGVLRTAGVAALLLVLFWLGSVFGTLEMATIATTDALGRASWSGVTLAGFAAGSLAGGLWFGSRKWTGAARVRLATALTLLAVVMVPTIWAAHSVALLPAGFAAGIAISPALICGVSVMKTLVRDDQLTEAMAWVSTALAVGVAAGTAAAGVICEQYSVWWGFPAATLCAVVAALIAWLWVTVAHPGSGTDPHREDQVTAPTG